MAKFKFTIEAGCFAKNQIKRDLERSKEKLEIVKDIRGNGVCNSFYLFTDVV